MNGLNNPTKGRDCKWKKKQDPSLCCLQETCFIFKDTNRFPIKKWKIYYANSTHKKAGVAILYQDKINLQKL